MDDELIPPGDALGVPFDRWQSLDTAIRAGDWRGGLGHVETIRHALDGIERRLVASARASGASWAEVGEAIGMTKQAAHYRYGKTVG